MLVTLLLAVLVPTLVAAGVGRFGRGMWWSSAAVGLGYVAGQIAVARPAIPPADVTDRIPWVALAATALTLLESVRSARIVGRATLAMLTVVLVLGPIARTGDEMSHETKTELITSAIVAFVALASLEALAAGRRKQGTDSDLTLALIVTAAGAGVALLLSGSAVLGLLGTALTASLFAAWLVSKDADDARFLPVAASVLTFLIIEGRVYASLPTHCALLLAGAPSTCWLTRIGPIRRLGALPRAAIATALALVPAAIAVGLAVQASSPYE